MSTVDIELDISDPHPAGQTQSLTMISDTGWRTTLLPCNTSSVQPRPPLAVPRPSESRNEIFLSVLQNKLLSAAVCLDTDRGSVAVAESNFNKYQEVNDLDPSQRRVEGQQFLHRIQVNVS